MSYNPYARQQQTYPSQQHLPPHQQHYQQHHQQHHQQYHQQQYPPQPQQQQYAAYAMPQQAYAQPRGSFVPCASGGYMPPVQPVQSFVQSSVQPTVQTGVQAGVRTGVQRGGYTGSMQAQYQAPSVQPDYTVSDHALCDYTLCDHTLCDYTVSDYTICDYTVSDYTVSDYTLCDYTVDTDHCDHTVRLWRLRLLDASCHAVAVAFTLINEHLDAGICLRDFACLVYFVCWSPCLYRTLQLDSDYWTEQIEKHIAASLSGSTISSIRSEISPEDDAVALDAETRMAIRTHVLREASLLISPVELVEQSVLSRDFFVTIALCSYQRQDVIVKWFTLNRFTADALGDVLREARILQRVRHQNTVEFIGISCDLPRVGLVMENLANGDLFQALSEKRVDWSKTTPLKMALEICAGLLYLHQRDMVHGDVKSKNVFLDDNWNCKVADFGESMLLDMAGNNDTVRGTGAWVAPELFASPQCLSFHSDVYSFGVLLWELFTWRYPFVFVSSLVSPKKRGKENNAGENNAGAANETEAAAELLPRRQVTPRELSNAVTAERLVLPLPP
ncbi:MAG: hypothetical protein MHM6MM_000923 [Cercozoa sp. M6MM]